jgi:hypothetical protein
MKFDRRFPGVSETRRRFGLVSGVVGQTSPNGAAARAGVWWSGWIPRLRFAPRGMTGTALRGAFINGLLLDPPFITVAIYQTPHISDSPFVILAHV